MGSLSRIHSCRSDDAKRDITLAVVITRALSPEIDDGQNRIGGTPACPVLNLTVTRYGDEGFRQGRLIDDSKPRRSTSLIRGNLNINGERQLALAA
jgi:hypothetical protein